MSDKAAIKPLNKTKRQRAVLKLLQLGCSIYQPHPKMKPRLLDDRRNPVSYVHARTLNALSKKSLIKKNAEGSYVAAPVSKTKTRNEPE